MPNYSNLLDTGATGNPMSPYGSTGPQYNLLSVNPAGGGTSLTNGTYVQSNALDPSQWSTPTSTPMGTTQDTPMLNATTGLYVSSKTGKPFTGKDASGVNYANGQQTTVAVPYSGGQQINPNNASQRFQAASIPENPDASALTGQAVKGLSGVASQVPDFSKLLQDEVSKLGQTQAQTTAQTAVAPFANTQQGLQSQYSAAIGALPQQYADINTQTNAALQNIVDQENQITGPQLDQSIANQEGLAIGNSNRYLSANLSANGTSGNAGSYGARLAAANAANITVPMEQYRLNAKTAALQNFAMPAALDAAQRATQLVANFDPMVASQQFQSGQATEQTIQQMAMAVGKMGTDQAMTLMQAMQIPYNVQQSLLNGDIQGAIAANAAYKGSNYQGLQDLLGANVTPAVGYNMNTPGYPPANRYSGLSGQGSRPGTSSTPGSTATQNTGTSSTPGSTATQNTGTNSLGAPNWSGGYGAVPANTGYNPSNNTMYNNTPTLLSQAYASLSPSNNSGSQSNSYYDPTTGMTIDRTTGLPTGYGTTAQSGIPPNTSYDAATDTMNFVPTGGLTPGAQSF